MNSFYFIFIVQLSQFNKFTAIHSTKYYGNIATLLQNSIMKITHIYLLSLHLYNMLNDTLRKVTYYTMK